MLNLEPSCQLDFRIKSDVLVVSAMEEKKRERKILLSVACAGI